MNGLRDVVLADPELREVARKATTLEELEALWQSPRFREKHEELAYLTALGAALKPGLAQRYVPCV